MCSPITVSSDSATSRVAASRPRRRRGASVWRSEPASSRSVNLSRSRRLLPSLRDSRVTRGLIALLLLLSGQVSALRSARGLSCARGVPAVAAARSTESWRNTTEGGATITSAKVEGTGHATVSASAQEGINGPVAPASGSPLRCTSGTALPIVAAGPTSERPRGANALEPPRASRIDAPAEPPFHPPRLI